jgi:hypothetical protein
MGLDRTVRFPHARSPGWDAIRTQLARVMEAPSLRMIDGMPAFPDETPPDDWKELRVGTPAGMVTIRRVSDQHLTCVVWGNADPALNAAWAKVLWACAAAAGGLVETASGTLAADDFARAEGISPA